jgi:precorrin-6x reductase
MNDLDLAQEDFRKKIGDFLIVLQTMGGINQQIFQEIDIQAKLLARLLKDRELISKSLLNELHIAVKILRAEAPFAKDQQVSLVRMAEQLELTFDLILRGECHNDRIPGVPRVI